MTPNQRRTLRDYISAVGVGKIPLLLTVLTEIEDDPELLMVSVIASIFDGRTPRERAAREARERAAELEVARKILKSGGT
jgi:hypothetical protein